MFQLVLLAALLLPPGAPDVTQSEWRLVASRFIHLRQQGTDAPYILLGERYLDSTSQNEAEFRRDINVVGSPVVVVAWGRADSPDWESFLIDRGYVVCVNKIHVIPVAPKATGQWYDLFGPEGDACRTLSAA